MPRRSNDQALSLFAFQDIITGVAGVMLFILLLLVVQLAIRTTEKVVEKPQPEKVQRRRASDEQVEQLQQAKQRLQQLQQRSATLLDAQSKDVDADIAEARRKLAELKAAAERQKAQAQRNREMLDSKERAEQVQTSQETIEKLSEKIAQIQQQKSKWADGKLASFTATNVGAGELWMVDVRSESASLFEIRDPGQAVRVRYASAAPAAATMIAQKLSELTKSKTVIVLLRPSAAGWGNQLLVDFRRMNYRVALELIDETTQVAAPEDDR